MGMFKLFSDSSPPISFRAVPVPPDPNPNPFRFKIEATKPVGRYVVVHAHYPDCTTHGGHKVMVYDDAGELERALAKKHLDPHFLEDPNTLSPVARFPGNAAGWRDAVDFAEFLASKGGSK